MPPHVPQNTLAVPLHVFPQNHPGIWPGTRVDMTWHCPSLKCQGGLRQNHPGNGMCHLPWQHKPVFNSPPRQVTLLVLLMSIINLIKNSEKEPKIKRVWLMTLPQIPKKIRYGAQTLTCFWGHTQCGQGCWIALTEKALVFRALRQTFRYSIAININHHGTMKARSGHNQNHTSRLQLSHIHEPQWPCVSMEREKPEERPQEERGLFPSPFWGATGGLCQPLLLFLRFFILNSEQSSFFFPGVQWAT